MILLVIHRINVCVLYYSLGLTSTATSYGPLGTGGSGGKGTYVLSPARYTVTTRMILH